MQALYVTDEHFGGCTGGKQSQTCAAAATAAEMERSLGACAAASLDYLLSSLKASPLGEEGIALCCCPHVALTWRCISGRRFHPAWNVSTGTLTPDCKNPTPLIWLCLGAFQVHEAAEQTLDSFTQ